MVLEQKYGAQGTSLREYVLDYLIEVHQITLEPAHISTCVVLYTLCAMQSRLFCKHVACLSKIIFAGLIF